ncbi:hypothetical protein Dimus_027547 [Dionaea muscipula]
MIFGAPQTRWQRSRILSTFLLLLLLKIMSSSSSSNQRMSGTGGTQACAACKYQRRKCAPDCILAPHFPYNEQKQFLNAHKLFGVKHITKFLRDLTPQQKDIAMHTIKYESNMRALDPVGGCYRYMIELQHHIDVYNTEMELVLHRLAICKAQDAVAAANNIHNDFNINNNNAGAGSSTTSSINDVVVYDHHHPYYQAPAAAAAAAPLPLSSQPPPPRDIPNEVLDHVYDPWAMQDSSSSSTLTLSALSSDGCRGTTSTDFASPEDDQSDDVKPLVDMLSIYDQNCVKFEPTSSVPLPCRIDDGLAFVDHQETRKQRRIMHQT